VEIAGSIDSGIAAFAWSPDFELVVFTTNTGNVLLMTQDWDVITEKPILEEVPEKIESTKMCVSWRGDGHYFVVAHEIGGKSELAIWERSGILEARSEDVKGLGVIASWK